MVTVEVATFLTVTVFVLDPPTTTLPKFKFGGVKVKGTAAPPCPVPLSPPEVGLPAALCVTVNAPLICPEYPGVKVTANEHFAFGASVPLHGLAPLPTAE